MSFATGENVDWYQGGAKEQTEKWHGVVVGRKDDRIEVFWLKSNRAQDFVPLAATGSRQPYERGYVTIQTEGTLRRCDGAGQVHQTQTLGETGTGSQMRPISGAYRSNSLKVSSITK